MVKCLHGFELNLKKSTPVRYYLARRVVILRHGCLCNANHTYWQMKRIAEALGMPFRTVQEIIKRWK